MASPTRTLTVNFVGRTENLERAFKRVNKGSSLMSDKLARTMRMGIGAIGGLGAAFGGLVALTKPMVDAASDVGESLSKNTVLFGKSADKVASWSESTSRSFGISRREALEAVGQFGALTHAMGMSGEEGSEMSVRMVELAADMASFNNASPAETLIAIQAGLRGEQEPLRRFGVLLDQATLKQRALSEGIITTTKGALTPQQKALAAYSEILEQTRVQQGDFERTSDGLANKQRILSAVWDDLQVKLGKKLLPAFQSVIAWLADHFIPGIEELFEMDAEEMGKKFGEAIADGMIDFLKGDEPAKQVADALQGLVRGAVDSLTGMGDLEKLLTDAGFLTSEEVLAAHAVETRVANLTPAEQDQLDALTSWSEAAAVPEFTTTPGMGALPPHHGGGRGSRPPDQMVFDPAVDRAGGHATGPLLGAPVLSSAEQDQLDALTSWSSAAAVPSLPTTSHATGPLLTDVQRFENAFGHLTPAELGDFFANAASATHANAPVMNNQITINTGASADEVVDRLGEYVRANGPLNRNWINQG